MLQLVHALHLIDDACGDPPQKHVGQVHPIGRHSVRALDDTQRHVILIGSAVPHDTHCLHGKKHSKALPDLPVPVGGLELLDDDAVCGLQQTFYKQRPAGRGKTAKVDVDDAFCFLAKFKGGAIGTFEATRVAPGRKNYNCVEISGTKGSIRWNLERMNELEVELLKNGYPLIDQSDSGRCCEDVDMDDRTYSCEWKIEKVELPPVPTSLDLQSGDGPGAGASNLGPLGALAAVQQSIRTRSELYLM